MERMLEDHKKGGDKNRTGEKLERIPGKERMV